MAYAQGEIPNAKAFYERSLELRRAAGNQAGMAASLNNLGNVMRALGFQLEAVSYLEQSERAFQELGNRRSRATVLNNLGILYGYLGDFDRALQYDNQSMDIARELRDNIRISSVLNSMGVIHNWIGNYRLALDELNQSLHLREELHDEWAVAETWNNIGLVFQSQSGHRQALEYFGKALALNQKLGDKNLESESRLETGAELLALGRVTESLREFNRSLNLSETEGLKTLQAESLQMLGRVQLRLGKMLEALQSFDRAAAIQMDIGDRAGLADTLVELAVARLQSGESAQALDLARRVAKQAADISRPETLWQAKLVSGKALRKIGQTKEAAADLDGAIVAIEALRLSVAGPATALPAYFGDRLEPYRERVLLDLAQGDAVAALMHAERSKSRALTEALRGGRPNPARWTTEEERRRERELENELAALNIRAAKAFSGPSPEKQAELRTAFQSKRRELESFQAALYARHPELPFALSPEPSRESSDLPSAPPSDPQALAAPSGTVILDYVVTRDVTYLFVLQSTGPLKVFKIRMSAEGIGKKAAEFHRLLASRDLGFAAMSGELYHLLVAPAAKELAKSSSWIVIPDGPLWDVAFQALESRPGRYLIEDAAISYAPSLNLLRATLRTRREGSAQNPELLAVGNPAARSAQDLPEAGKLVLALQKLYGEQHSRILTGSTATEERFKSEAGRYQVLHIAAHAVLDNASPAYSRILLATAGAGSREDGFLEAREMMDLDLRAEMVILSGCETAAGKAAPGEGITGMLWATFVAGAPTTVASLWPVESVSTSELMVEFHRQWLANRNQAHFQKAAAMRAAAQKLIASPQYAHPFYWAGFIVAGNPN